jgi:glycine cleavage system H protein
VTFFYPLTGTITEVNPSLANQPELVNSDPYGEGWMIKMTVDSPTDFEHLMTA